MKNTEIVRFLRCPSSQLVDFAIRDANLTTKEALVVSMCARQGLTREEAAEAAGYSVDAVQKWYASGIRKLEAHLKGQWWFEKIMK